MLEGPAPRPRRGLSERTGSAPPPCGGPWLLVPGLLLRMSSPSVTSHPRVRPLSGPPLCATSRGRALSPAPSEALADGPPAEPPADTPADTCSALLPRTPAVPPRAALGLAAVPTPAAWPGAGPVPASSPRRPCAPLAAHAPSLASSAQHSAAAPEGDPAGLPCLFSTFPPLLQVVCLTWRPSPPPSGAPLQPCPLPQTGSGPLPGHPGPGSPLWQESRKKLTT